MDGNWEIGKEEFVTKVVVREVAQRVMFRGYENINFLVHRAPFGPLWAVSVGALGLLLGVGEGPERAVADAWDNLVRGQIKPEVLARSIQRVEQFLDLQEAVAKKVGQTAGGSQN